jgi:NADPH-dependent glutamate synthase beta subunit-like oxidoreductase
VDDLAIVMKEGQFDAVFLAVGAHLARRAFIPARDARKIFYAASLLRDLEEGATPLLGRRVLVFGGGNTALDTARTAKRLGAEDALIVYRRTRQKMPVKDYEIQEAMEEGVSFKWLTTVKASNAESFVIERMQLDENGFPQPTGEFETLAADSLILALGQDVDLGFLKRVEGLAIEDGVVRVDEHMMTGCPGVFAGGDMVPAERAVSVAVGHGKKAARNIDAYLRGDVYERGVEREIATFDRLNLRTHNRTARTTQQPIDLSRRQATFDEVFAGLDEGSALFEAKRCLSCGNCNECDNCYQICPGEAIQKLGAGKRFKFEYGNCDGCGLCAEECPCGAIQMQGIEKGGLGLNWA